MEEENGERINVRRLIVITVLLVLIGSSLMVIGRSGAAPGKDPHIPLASAWTSERACGYGKSFSCLNDPSLDTCTNGSMKFATGPGQTATMWWSANISTHPVRCNPATGGTFIGWNFADGTWTNVTDTTNTAALAGLRSPYFADYDGCIAYDPNLNGYFAIFSNGGQTGAWPFLYSGSTWENLTNSLGEPPHQIGGATQFCQMGYDPSVGTIVMTWEQQGAPIEIFDSYLLGRSGFTNITPVRASQPSLSSYAELAYDPSGGNMVFYGYQGWISTISHPQLLRTIYYALTPGQTWLNLTNGSGPHPPDNIDELLSTWGDGVAVIGGSNASGLYANGSLFVYSTIWYLRNGAWTNITSQGNFPATETGYLGVGGAFTPKSMLVFGSAPSATASGNGSVNPTQNTTILCFGPCPAAPPPPSPATAAAASGATLTGAYQSTTTVAQTFYQNVSHGHWGQSTPAQFSVHIPLGNATVTSLSAVLTVVGPTGYTGVADVVQSPTTIYNYSVPYQVSLFGINPTYVRVTEYTVNLSTNAGLGPSIGTYAVSVTLSLVENFVQNLSNGWVQSPNDSYSYSTQITAPITGTLNFTSYIGGTGATVPFPVPINLTSVKVYLNGSVYRNYQWTYGSVTVVPPNIAVSANVSFTVWFSAAPIESGSVPTLTIGTYNSTASGNEYANVSYFNNHTYIYAGYFLIQYSLPYPISISSITTTTNSKLATNAYVISNSVITILPGKVTVGPETVVKFTVEFTFQNAPPVGSLLASAKIFGSVFTVGEATLFLAILFGVIGVYVVIEGRHSKGEQRAIYHTRIWEIGIAIAAVAAAYVLENASQVFH